MTSKRNVEFFDYSDLFEKRDKEYLGIIEGVLRRGAFILQEDLRRFEENIQKFLGVTHAFGVSDGTNALVLALKALDIGPGDEVILPSHTYIATAGAVRWVGATPILVECGDDHLIDPDSAEKAITSATKILMPVQLNGRTANMDRLMAMANYNGIKVIEDAAQAFGARFKGQSAGTFGAAGTFSFYPAKTLGCFGDGGAIVTNDDAIARRLFLLRDHGRDEHGKMVEWGTNSRLDNLQAAILDHKLKTYDEDVARRREVALLYHSRLANLRPLTLPPKPDISSDHFDVFQNFEIRAAKREQLISYLSDRGVKTVIQWGGQAIHQISELELTYFTLPYTDRLFEECMLLPLNTSLSDDDIEYVCTHIRAFYGED